MFRNQKYKTRREEVLLLDIFKQKKKSWPENKGSLTFPSLPSPLCSQGTTSITPLRYSLKRNGFGEAPGPEEARGENLYPS